MASDRRAAGGCTWCDLPLPERSDAGPCLQDAITLENCVLRCISRHCYDEVYLDDPLEEGEVDTQRGRTFRTCARNELRADRKARRDATRNGEDAVDDVDTSK